MEKKKPKENRSRGAGGNKGGLPAKKRKRLVEKAELALKIERYRGDILSDEALDEVRAVRFRLLETAAGTGITPEHATEVEGEADTVLARHGGKIFPKTMLSDNAETFLVAAIVVLAIRAFFLQPFIIPTNSMYPSYSGMRYEIFNDAETPALPVKAFRLAAFGSRTRTVSATESGEVEILLGVLPNGAVEPLYQMASGRNFLVLPTQVREYSFRVGHSVASLRVPADFPGGDVLLDAFFPGAASWQEVVRRGQLDGRVQPLRENTLILRTGKRAVAGEPFLAFEILSGDALFVDRLSYHFVRPDIGDPIVFRTGGIPALAEDKDFGDKYYIKRLVGEEGDVLAIRDYELFRNGEPITGAKAFALNAERKDGFPGYRNLGLLGVGESFEVPEDSFMALGDNSANSLDSRYWGSLPEDAVVGRAILIYYPFTKRWGFAQ